MKRSQRRKGEGGWWMWGGAGFPPVAKYNTDLNSARHLNCIHWQLQSCSVPRWWLMWADWKMNFLGRGEAGCCLISCIYSLLSHNGVCFSCLWTLCAHAWLSTDVRGRERGERGRWRPARRKGSAKMMFDMRGEARSRGTCSVRQQVARRISQSPQTSISTLDRASSSRYF